MANFHLELIDQRGSHFHGPYSGVMVIGSHQELCQLTLPGHLPLENRHAELRPTAVSYQLTLSPCSSAARVYLWRQGRPWLLAQPSVIQHGERFSLLTPDGPTFRVLAMDHAPELDAQAPKVLPRKSGAKLAGTLTCMGTLMGLALVALVAQWLAGPDVQLPKMWKRDNVTQVKPEKPEEEFEIIRTREFIRNSKGDASKEMDRWTTISGNNNYRSARIHSFEQLRMIQQRHGIKQILNLAMDSMSKQRDPARKCGGLQRPCEPIWAKELGLDYFSVYLGSKPPKQKDWEMIQSLLKAGDTLVHCTHGVDRTGAVVGKWQHLVDESMTREELLDYTYSFGGQWKLPGDPNRHLRAWMVEDVAD